MKILTKQWANEYEKAKFILQLKEIDDTIEYETIKFKSKKFFLNKLREDKELAELTLKSNLSDELYKAQIDRNRKIILSLPTTVYSKISNVETIVLGFAIKKDKKFLTNYAKILVDKIKKSSDYAYKISKMSQSYLDNNFSLDELVDELVYEEYSDKNNYYLTIGRHKVCVENFEILERDNFNVNPWNQDDPLSLWTSVRAVELHYTKDNCFILHLLLIDGDEYENIQFWYFTIKGTKIKFT